MLYRIRQVLSAATLLAVTSPFASAGSAERATIEHSPFEPHMERLSELLERLPGEIAGASERLSAMTGRLLALLPDDARLDDALTQFRLFLDGLYLKFSGETAPIPGYREVRERVLHGDEAEPPRESDGIEV